MSIALVLVPAGADASCVVNRAAAIAEAMNLALELAPVDGAQADDAIARLARTYGARTSTTEDGDGERSPALADLRASLVAVPLGDVARRFASGSVTRDLLIVDPVWAATHAASGRPAAFDRAFGQTLADRQRIGYGKLTVYLGAAAGCGKTYAMLDRAHQLQNAGVDVVAAFVETHGRKETARLLEGLPLLPRKKVDSHDIAYEELDLDALLARKPSVALIDELAHTNAPGSIHIKRWLDVLTVIRAGISVITTLNVQHLEGLNDVVRRLTGVAVRETIADPVLEFADEVVLIDASPQTLRDRLRAGKIYPKERIDAALSSFFQTENLLALRELAVREALRSRKPAATAARVDDLLLGVAGRDRDAALIRRCARLASRMGVDLSVMHVAKPREPRPGAIALLESTTKEVGAKWTLAVAERQGREMARRSLLSGAMLVVEGARQKPTFLRGASFARRALEEGAVQLLVLAPAK
jgi:K+-sensing histidine kinase KdpD